MPMLTFLRCDHERCRALIEIHQAGDAGWIIVPVVSKDGYMIRRKSRCYCPAHWPENRRGKQCI